MEKNETSEREGNDEEGGGLWGDKDEGKTKVKKYNPGRGQINSNKQAALTLLYISSLQNYYVGTQLYTGPM